MVMYIWVNIGSGNGLLPDGTKTFLEPILTYRQVSNIRLTKSPNTEKILVLSLPNPLKPGVKSRMKM